MPCRMPHEVLGALPRIETLPSPPWRRRLAAAPETKSGGTRRRGVRLRFARARPPSCSARVHDERRARPRGRHLVGAIRRRRRPESLTTMQTLRHAVVLALFAILGA